MKKGVVLFIAMILICSGLAFAEGKKHWGYSGHEGPSHWGELSPEFELCGSGKNQSPVDLKGMIEADLEPIIFDYKPMPLEVVNNGHTIKVAYENESSIKIEGQTFKLLQVHFHSPSENLIDGKSFPMEAHLVHADDNGNLAVVAVMFEKGADNSTINTVWAHMPFKVGKVVSQSKIPVDLNEMLPENRDYYRFNGSLTTPPCTEGVRWFVMKEALQTSQKQLDVFHAVMHEDNNRPVQPLNARPVMK